MRLLPIKKQALIILSSVLILLIGTLIVFISIKKEAPQSSVVSTPDLVNHPIYSNYKLDLNDSVINIGIQPLYLPTGIIMEVVKRDKILNKTLVSLGKKIEYFSFLKGADVNFFLLKGALDGGVGGAMPALSASLTSDVIIPIIIQKGNISIVADKPMLTNDLKRKKIGYAHGSISHFFILELLYSGGFTEEMVSLIPMAISEMADALHNKEIDLYSSWEPNVAADYKKHPDSYVTFKKITNGYLYFSADFVHQNTKIVNHMLAALLRAITWMKSDRDNLLLACDWNLQEMEKLTGGKSILNAEEMADLALKDILGYLSIYESVISEEEFQYNSSLHKEFDFLLQVRKKEGDFDWEHTINSLNNDLIIEILEHPKVFQLYNYNYEIGEGENAVN